MTERETTRLIAWSQELRTVHARLRDALNLTRTAVAEGGEVAAASRELLLYCRGFCSALSGHHSGEDLVLYPALAAAHPHLKPVLATLSQDHSMLNHLLGELDTAVDRAVDPGELARHLEGVAALMDHHFAYEERQLLGVLENLDLVAETHDALGPL